MSCFIVDRKNNNNFISTLSTNLNLSNKLSMCFPTSSFWQNSAFWLITPLSETRVPLCSGRLKWSSPVFIITSIRGISLCSLSVIVTPQYVRDASGSVLFPDKLLHKLYGKGLAKSTICWISLFLLPLFPPCIFSCLSVVVFFPFPFITNLGCLENRSFMLFRTESSVKASCHFFFHSLQTVC